MTKIEAKLIDKAVEEQCRKTAIGFAEWINENKYEYWDSMFNKGWFDEIGEGIAETTEQLYELYLKTLNNE